jgi:CheY-like chemotaxis protein
VLAAADAREALALSAEYPGAIHLLLTDVIMPGMNGKELADRLRLSRPDIKVLFVSGYTAEVISRQGILEGGVSLISKPFSPRELLNKIRQTLDNP